MHAQQAGQRIFIGPYGTRGRGCRDARGQTLPPALGTICLHWGHMTLMTRVLEVDGAAATAQHSLSYMETTRAGGACCSWGHPTPREAVPGAGPEPQPPLPGSRTCPLCRLHLWAPQSQELTLQHQRWPANGSYRLPVQMRRLRHTEGQLHGSTTSLCPQTSRGQSTT